MSERLLSFFTSTLHAALIQNLLNDRLQIIIVFQNKSMLFTRNLEIPVSNKTDRIVPP